MGTTTAYLIGVLKNIFWGVLSGVISSIIVVMYYKWRDDRPLLEVIGCKQGLNVQIKNIGNKTAEKVRLVVRAVDGYASSAEAYMTSGVQQFFQGVENTLQIRRSIPNGHVPGLIEFCIEYQYKKKKYISDSYFLVLDAGQPVGLTKK